YTLLHDRRNWKYWCSVLGSFLGLYLMVMKGLDLNSVAERLSIKDLSGTGLFVAGYRVTAALLGIVSSIHQYLASPSGFIFGLLITAGSVYWAYRRKALDFFGAALGLFLLGFSIHLYLLIRSGLNPPVNMGQPETLKAFWAVISREQYGSAYGILPRQVWQMITQKADISSLSDLAANIKVYFQYNLPFYTKYFGWQFGHGFWALIFTALGIYGAVEHARHEKKSFYFWLAVFLMTGLILNTYMNFKLGYSQALDKYPKDTPLHEVRERDYFFIVSFAFFGVWSGLGLAAVLDRLRKAFAVDTDDPKLRKPVFYLLAAAVLLPGLVPLILNFGKVDRSGNYIPPDYARNVMNSLEPGAIIFTNGDNDTYPLWYIREVEGVRTDCRVVNLSLLNTGWYIKQMRDMEPKVPISLSDEAIWKLRPFILQKGHKFQFGEVELIFQDSSVIDIKDMVILDILRTNNWRKPLYFTTTTPTSNRCHLEPYLVQHGVVYKINPRRARSLAAEDSMNLIEIGGNGACFDIRDTRRLFDRVYRFKAFPHDPAELEEEEVQALGPFAYASSVLGQAYSQRGEFADAAEILSTARQLRNDRHQLNMVMANLYTRSSQYEKAYAFLDSLVNVTGDRNPQVFMELAQIALSKGGTGPSLKLMEMCTDFFPDYKDAYANLFMVHEADGDTAAAVAVVGKYLELFPEDNVVAEELKRYRETGEIDLRKAFQIPLP
ncbi:MAG: tetratricopeptide repeat protein, partial [Candidatus Glassbacteria bacterium]|nr:tetratricopeptide repeat protein [Candidatus Glassbacteria bacterium]